MAPLQAPKPGQIGFGAEESPVRRPYSLDELLRMKDAHSLATFDISKLSSEVSDVIKMPRHGRKRQTNDTSMPKSLTGTINEQSHSRTSTLNHQSSTDSDEDMVVYRGHRSRPLHNEIKWQLRRRDSSERSSQPLSAPSGLEAQKSENFQKFYRAVVSPTHVRVTAGGRIVPNTRLPPQPAFTWNTEKKFFEQSQRPPTPDLDQQGAWLQGVPLNDMALYSPTGNIQKSGDSGFDPVLGSNISRLSLAHHTAQNTLVASLSQLGALCNDPASSSHKGVSQEGIKISPPNQFDVSRPFMYNGQLVYPVPPGFQVPQNVPVVPNMLGNPHMVRPYPPALSGTLFPAHMQVLSGNTINPLAMGLAGPQSALPNAPNFAPIILPSQSPHTGQHSNPMPLMPSTSLSTPALIAAHQIQVLQQQIKSMDIQLQSNTHQIDTRHVTIQRDSIQNQIFTLQSIINASLGAVNQEAVPFITSYGTGIPDSSVTADITPSTWDALGTTHGSENMLLHAGSQFTSHLASTVEIEEPTKKGHIPSTAKANLIESPVKYEPPSRKRLTAAAAMAPPFQPRIQQPITRKPTEEKEKNALKGLGYNPDQLSNPDETTAEIEARLLSKSGNWAPLPHQLNSVPMRSHSQVPMLSKAHSMHHPTYSSHFNRSMPTLKKFATIQGHDPSDFRDRVPYLRGYPPRDVPVGEVKPGDFLYTRKLTEDEIRAKYLYWGKAPREAMRGLPKWDGRDFYPPSPAKDSASPAAQFPEKNQRLQQESDAVGVPLEIKFRESGGAVQGSHSHRKLSTLSDTFYEARSTMLSTITKGARDGGVTNADDKASVDSWSVPNTIMQKVFEPPVCRSSSIPESESALNSTASASFNDTANRPTTLHQPLASTSQPSPSLLQGMLRNTPQTTMAPATGAMSSATARGYLPPYRGSAAASLAPSINSITAPSLGLEKIVSYNDTDIPSRPDSSSSVLAENRPFSRSTTSPRNPMSVIHQLRRSKRLLKDRKDSIDSGLDQHTTGTGPVDSSEW